MTSELVKPKEIYKVVEWYDRGSSIARGNGNLKDIEYYVGENGCHICVSHHRSQNGNKYPTITFNGKKTSLTRYIWFLNTKELLERNVFVCHKCDNPHCINFEHLFLGTPKDNSQDMAKKGRQMRHTNLSDDDIFDIKSDYTYSSTELSKKYGVSYSTICRIWNEEIYAHIKIEDYKEVCEKRNKTSRSKKAHKKYDISDDDLLGLNYKEAKQKYGISKNQFYNLRRLKREEMGND